MQEVEGTDDRHPWLRLEELAEREAWSEVRELLEALDEPTQVLAAAHLPPETLAAVLGAIGPEQAAELIENLPEVQAASAVEAIEPGAAAEILEELPSDERADLLGRMNPEEVDAILSEADAELRDEARALLVYQPDTAGGLMATECFTVSDGWTVEQVVRRIRSRGDFADHQIQYVYVLDPRRRLVGVVPLRALIVARPEQAVVEVMIPDPLSVRADTALKELGEFFDHHGFLGVPVTDDEGRLLGIVHRPAVEEEQAETAQADHMKSLGIASGEELRSMPLLLRSGRRLSWLSVNILLNVLAASVIAAYQETLQAAIALAVFLPMISDMSGCSGSQAVAVSLRELSLGVRRPNELVQVWLKEVTLGALNGLALGVLIGLVALVWQGNVALGVVVGGALALNTVVAVSIGGTIPLLLRRLGQDPALASGPVLTTITDVCGFFLALSFATVMLDRLT